MTLERAKPQPSVAVARVVVAVALGYCAWLGWHWLPLDYSDGELAGFVSRLWDVRRELADRGALPWWTPYYMGGSSYGLHHSQGLYLVPSLVFACFFDLLVAVKLSALLAIFAGAVAMFYCARHFVRNEWGAALAAFVFLLHPQQLVRAAGVEHLGISVFLPFVPLTWLLFARALESPGFRRLFWCALAVAGSMWAHNKMAFVNLLFLSGYLAYWVFFGASASAGAPGWREHARGALRTSALIGAVSLAVSAFFIVPGLTEAEHAKLFEGEPLGAWQASYSFKSLFALVDRDAALTREAVRGALDSVNARGGVRSEAEHAQLRRIVGLRTDSPEKYAGLVLLAALALTALAAHRRENRRLFRFLAGALLVSVMLAYGPGSVWSANAATLQALLQVEGVPDAARLAAWLAPLATLALLVYAGWRKLATPRARLLALCALLAFLLVPPFPLVAWLPFFREIRAPYVFFDAGGVFFGALLSGFLVTDVLKSRIPQIVAVLAVLLFIDYLPYQAPTRDNGIPARTLANLREAFASLRADDDAVKVYMLTGRFVRVLAPMLGGKPLAYESFYNWMAPKGTGYLNTQARGEPALFDLLGVRYVIFDKSDPRLAGAGPVLETYRRIYPVHRENEDFVVFRNPGARPYFGAFARAARFQGEIRQSAPLALALAQRNWPLIHAAPDSGEAPDRVYRAGEAAPLPEQEGRPVALTIESFARRGNGALRAVLTAGEPSWLVINESYFPYWRASLAGNDVPLYRASTGLMAVRLPAGRQDLSLEFSPPRSYLVAQLLSGAVLLVGLGFCWFGAYRIEGREK